MCVWVPCGGLCGTILDQLITLFIVSLGRSISRVLTPLQSGPYVSIGNTTGGRGLTIYVILFSFCHGCT